MSSFEVEDFITSLDSKPFFIVRFFTVRKIQGKSFKLINLTVTVLIVTSGQHRLAGF